MLRDIPKAVPKCKELGNAINEIMIWIKEGFLVTELVSMVTIKTSDLFRLVHSTFAMQSNRNKDQCFITNRKPCFDQNLRIDQQNETRAGFMTPTPSPQKKV